MLSNFISENFRLKTDQIFEGLTVSEVETLTESGVSHIYKKGEIIFREGGIPTGIFYIKSGRVKKYKTTPKGGEQIFYICGEGELLGYHALLGEEYYPDSAATIELSEVAFIPKESFMTILKSSSVLAFRLLKALGHEFTFFLNSFTNLATKTVRERLAFTLLVLDEKYKSTSRAQRSSEIDMSRGDLANMVGTAKETLVRLLQEFKRDRLIESNGRAVHIVDRKGLVREANVMGQNPRKLRGN